jgi:hypothetical protein
VNTSVEPHAADEGLIPQGTLLKRRPCGGKVERMAERPDFVIAGAARCGTTALHEYLSQHPRVFMPVLKEPGFFSVDLPGGVSTLEEYRSLFAAAPAEVLTGEASTQYLYSRVAIERLAAHNPRVKVIVILRNPVDAAYSLHGYAYQYGHEHVGDFEAAWEAQSVRFGYARSTPAIPGGPIIEYDYRATYCYAGQVRRIIEQVPPQSRHFIVYEEFFADPLRHYAAMLEFLGLPPASPRTFAAVNSHVGVRSRWFERWMRQPPKVIETLYAPLRPLCRAVGLRPGRLAIRANRAGSSRQLLRPAFRAELERCFAPDVADLEQLLGRRLWSATA